MRKSICSTLLLAAVAAATVFAQPAAAGEDFFDNPRLVTDGLPEGGIFRPVVPPATVGYPMPMPAADPVYRTYTSLPAETGGLTYVIDPLGTADLAVDVPSAPAAATVTAEQAVTVAVSPDAGAAATQDAQNVISFVVPVQIPAYVAAPPPPQQYQQQYDALQRQYAEQIRQIQTEYATRLRQQQEAYAEQIRQQQVQQTQYAEQVRQQQMLQEEYAARVQQQRARQEQYMAQVQQYRLQQEQQAAQARQQQAQYAEQMRQEMQWQRQQQQQQQQMQQASMQQQPVVRQFPPDQLVPAQPAQRLPQQQTYPAPGPEVPLTASRPADFGLAQPAGSAPVQAGDYASALTHPSTGGDRPVLTLITPAEVKQALNQGVRLILLDVRGELVRDVEGHIPGDVTVPYEPADTFPARVRQAIPSANLPVVVYCRDGIWSSKAGEVMARMGYRTYLMGAYRLWLWN